MFYFLYEFSLYPYAMHLYIVFSILYQSVVILIFNLMEASTLKYFLDFFNCKIISTRFVTPDVKVLFQLLILSTLCKSELCEIVPPIVTEVQDSTLWGHLVIYLFSYWMKVFRWYGWHYEQEYSEICQFWLERQGLIIYEVANLCIYIFYVVLLILLDEIYSSRWEITAINLKSANVLFIEGIEPIADSTTRIK